MLPKPRQPRRLFAFLAVLAGGALIYFEVLRRSGPIREGWFWLMVGGLLIAFGLAELFSRPPDSPGRR